MKKIELSKNIDVFLEKKKRFGTHPINGDGIRLK